MMVTLYNGVSGIKTNQYGMDVTANNIANTNTVGFKGSQAEFKDIFYQTNMVGGFNPVASSVGLGATVGGTALDLSQGSFQNTDNFLDLTIAGDGFFKVSGTANPDVYYTRAGEFFVDKNRDVVNSQGFYLMGTMANLTPATYSQAALDNLGMGAQTNALSVDPNAPVEFGTTQTKLTLPQNLYMPPEPTSNVAFKGTLSNEMIFGFVTKDLNLENGVLDPKPTGVINYSANVTDTPEFINYQKGELVSVIFTNAKGESLGASAAIKEDGSFEVANFDLSNLVDPGYNEITLSGKAGATNINLANAQFQYSKNGVANILADITNTPDLANLAPNTDVEITFKNAQGKEEKINAIFDGTQLSLKNYDITGLARTDMFDGIKVSATAPAKEELPTTAKFTSSLFSSTGYDNTLTINFTKQVPTNPEGINWNMQASVTDKTGAVLSQSEGVLSFNGDGALIGNTLGALSNGATPLAIDFGSFFDPTKPNSGFDGVIIGEKSAVSDQSKNGHADGTLRSYAINDSGSILAQFSNGYQATVAKIPVFHFQNDQGLFTEGGVFFSQTLNSGEPFMYTDANGKFYNGSNIKSFMLETSNVDIGNEMTMLIVQQRAYEASAKSISTGDQMLQRAINMKNDR